MMKNYIDGIELNIPNTPMDITTKPIKTNANLIKCAIGAFMFNFTPVTKRTMPIISTPINPYSMFYN